MLIRRLEAGGVGLVTRGTNPVIRELALPDSREGRRDLEVEASVKTLTKGVSRTSGLVNQNVPMCQEMDMLHTPWGPDLTLCISSSVFSFVSFRISFVIHWQ